MKPSIDSNDVDNHADAPLRQPGWGFRVNYTVLSVVARFLLEHGPRTRREIAGYLVRDSPMARTPNARRTTGQSTAIQSVVALGHLGLCARLKGLWKLTARGEEFARALGSPSESEVFRDVLLSNPSFQRIWNRLPPTTPGLGRRELMEYAERLYPEYNEETRRTLIGIFLSYARAAKLLHERSGFRRDRASHQPVLGKIIERSSHSQAAAAPLNPPGNLDTELTRHRGGGLAAPNEAPHGLPEWIIADDEALTDPAFRDAIGRAAQRALEPVDSGGSPHVAEVTLDLTRLALQREDADLIRIVLRLINGIIRDSSRGRAPKRE